ncbi:hypothetical protein [Psychromonas aquimarina]|uniref:hypothetical protein n=1 Tax=Psychromonas aquimarina TaxID=444919 RepID=UPI000400C677|nr:hypothetical protein [Psychromonas aquimarina]
MADYQFFKHKIKNTVVYLDVDSAAYYHEKGLLIEQGFAIQDDIFQIPAIEEDLNKSQDTVIESFVRYGAGRSNLGRS